MFLPIVAASATANVRRDVCSTGAKKPSQYAWCADATFQETHAMQSHKMAVVMSAKVTSVKDLVDCLTDQVRLGALASRLRSGTGALCQEEACRASHRSRTARLKAMRSMNLSRAAGCSI